MLEKDRYKFHNCFTFCKTFPYLLNRYPIISTIYDIINNMFLCLSLFIKIKFDVNYVNYSLLHNIKLSLYIYLCVYICVCVCL